MIFAKNLNMKKREPTTEEIQEKFMETYNILLKTIENDPVTKLLKNEETLTKERDYLTIQIEKERKMAEENVKINKTVALKALRHKNGLELKLQKKEGILATIKQLRESLERANITPAVAALQNAKPTTKRPSIRLPKLGKKFFSRVRG